MGQFLSLRPAEPGYVKLVQVKVDAAHAATVDLTRPLLVSPLLHPSGEHFGFIAIDGWHRIHRALSEGLTRLPGYVLSDATARAVRLPWP